MAKNNVIDLVGRDTIVDPLNDLLRAGAKKLIYQAVEAERQEQLARYSDRCTGAGRHKLNNQGAILMADGGQI